MDVVMPVKMLWEHNAKMLRTRDNVDCFIFNAEHASWYDSAVIILVFAWPKRPRQEIAQFSADVLLLGVATVTLLGCAGELGARGRRWHTALCAPGWCYREIIYEDHEKYVTEMPPLWYTGRHSLLTMWVLQSSMHCPCGCERHFQPIRFRL